MATKDPTATQEANVAAAVAKILTVLHSRNDSAISASEFLSLQNSLAAEFGRRRGWRLSASSFTIRALAKRQAPGSRTIESLDQDLFDHPYYYRESQRPFRAAALVAHVYDVPKTSDPVARLKAITNLATKADRLGLELEATDSFPSWHYPGWTTLLIYTPKS
jgi:hypothetical protein